MVACRADRTEYASDALALGLLPLAGGLLLHVPARFVSLLLALLLVGRSGMLAGRSLLRNG